MKLKTLLKWRIGDLLALRKLPEDGAEYRRRFKALCVDATPACAAEIKSAEPGSGLEPLRRSRRLWEVLGYAAIVAFLVTVAAFVLSYWLVSDRRLPWLSVGTMYWELAAIAVEVGLMLLCANRVTALQNGYTRQAMLGALGDFDALPDADADRFARILRSARDPKVSGQRCGCCACGALFECGVPDVTDIGDIACPDCGARGEVVFEGPDAPLDEGVINRLRSFLND